MSRRADAPPAPDWSWLAAWPDHYVTPGRDASPSIWGMYEVEYDFALTVYGRPAPQGSKRHVGKGRMVESSPNVGPWRDAVRAEAAKWFVDHAVGEQFKAPVAVRMVFTLPCPARAEPGDRPGVVPDLSKLVRSTEDALVDAGVLSDDKLIVEYDRVAKVYPRWDPESLDRPGAVIKIRRLA